MSVFAVFIDGPMAQETMALREAITTVKFPLPERVTLCTCDEGEEFSYPSEVATYYRIMAGPGLALYSKEDDPKVVQRNLLNWVVTDLSRVDKIQNYCMDRRAWC